MVLAAAGCAVDCDNAVSDATRISGAVGGDAAAPSAGGSGQAGGTGGSGGMAGASGSAGPEPCEPRVCPPLLGASGAAGAASLVPPPGCEGEIAFGDAMVEERIRELVGVPSGCLCYSDVWQLTELSDLRTCQYVWIGGPVGEDW